jgi:hypothetical protein
MPSPSGCGPRCRVGLYVFEQRKAFLSITASAALPVARTVDPTFKTTLALTGTARDAETGPLALAGPKTVTRRGPKPVPPDESAN